MDSNPKDFRKADLCGVQLQGKDLRMADFTAADLNGADLEGAVLSGSIFRKADLSGANLCGTNLDNAKCRGADFAGARFDRSSLYRVDFTGAAIDGAVLRDARLEEANLHGANLSWSDLEGADLRGACLAMANLNGASFRKVNLRAAHFSETMMGIVDLTGAIGLDSCIHDGPSAIDFRTIEMSGFLPFSFLLGCGLPESLVLTIYQLITQDRPELALSTESTEVDILLRSNEMRIEMIEDGSDGLLLSGPKPSGQLSLLDTSLMHRWQLLQTAPNSAFLSLRTFNKRR